MASGRAGTRLKSGAPARHIPQGNRRFWPTKDAGNYRYRSVTENGTKALKQSFRLQLVSRIYHPGPLHWKTKFEVLKMASIALVRVSGTVLSVPPARDYTFPQGSPRAGEKLTFESVNVLVADTNVTAVDLPRRDGTGIFENLNTRSYVKGEQVDFLCEVSIYKQDVQTRIVGLWPEDDAADLAA